MMPRAARAGIAFTSMMGDGLRVFALHPSWSTSVSPGYASAAYVRCEPGRSDDLSSFVVAIKPVPTSTTYTISNFERDCQSEDEAQRGYFVSLRLGVE